MTDIKAAGVQRYGFLLIDDFALMSFAAATEPLRAANLLARKTLYEVVALSADGAPVSCSSGFPVPCRDIAAHGASCHAVFVVAGGNPAAWPDSGAAVASLRRLAKQGVRIGGISSGALVLAEAGLLDRSAFTIHWEHAAVLAEAFPHLDARQTRFVTDGNRVTCAGGVAPLDMMHALIADRMGSAFARRVSDWFLHTGVVPAEGSQRGAAAERFGTHHPALLKVMEAMESAVENPKSRRTMAQIAGVSPRHLDRLFIAAFNRSFSRVYADIRLDHARRLLEQSPLSISETGLATGFSSPSHFTRSYTARFGHSPRQARRSGTGA